MAAALPFYDEVERDMEGRNTLVVLARGLGMAAVLARFVSARVRPGRLILALNVPRDTAVHVIWPALRRAATARRPPHPALLLPRFVNADYSAPDRAAVYRTGGFVVASATVLVHDLLCANLPVDAVDGVVVFAADRVRPNSNTHFVLTLFRKQNRAAFVHAVSENAPALCVGFHYAEKVMRVLHVHRLSNWPRFRTAVKESLARRTPDVVDLSVQLSAGQARVMRALRDVAARVLDDLRLAARGLDLSDVYVKQRPGETGPRQLVANFDDVVRRQLQVAQGQRRLAGGDKVRSLVADLAAVRSLLSDATDLNAVLFYQRVLTIRHTQDRGSYWLMRQDAQSMLRHARARIFLRRQPADDRGSNEQPSRAGARDVPENRTGLAACGEPEKEAAQAAEEETPVGVTVPVLEPSPKWHALKAVLDEIEADVKELGPEADLGRVIIAVRDQCMFDELRNVLTLGSEQYMRSLFQVVLPAVAKNVRWYDDKTERDRRSNRGRQVTMTQMMASKGDSPGRDGTGNGNDERISNGPSSKRRRVESNESGKAQGSESRGWSDRRRRSDDELIGRPDLPGSMRERRGRSTSPASADDPNALWPWPVRLGSGDAGPEEGVDGTGTELGGILPGLKEYFGVATRENPAKHVEVLLWCLEWLDVQGRAKALLDDYRPSFVIMYNADVGFVRQVEVYRAESPGKPVRLYLLAYEDIVDEDRYRNVIEREQDAFKNLIRERATMLLQQDDDGGDVGRGSSEEADHAPAALVADAGRALGVDRDSRLNLGGHGPASKARIIVDTRELRSQLPMMLYESGVTIVPVTLEVGDFVLSKALAIERKSVSDLYGSFNSGRLFKQADALCRHYKHACLLIELEAGAKMSLASTSGGVPSELVPTSIVSKMVLLLQQFPTFRLLWAAGAQEAAELFMSLKTNEEEPSEEEAASHGVDSTELIDSEFNSGPATFLRSLPGIDGKNIVSVMRKVSNVSTLLSMSLDEMTSVLGSSGKAQQLYNFANEEPSEALASL